MIAKAMMMTVMQKMPPKANFFRKLKRTFQSKLIGTRITDRHCQWEAPREIFEGQNRLKASVATSRIMLPRSVFLSYLTGPGEFAPQWAEMISQCYLLGNPVLTLNIVE